MSRVRAKERNKFESGEDETYRLFLLSLNLDFCSSTILDVYVLNVPNLELLHLTKILVLLKEGSQRTKYVAAVYNMYHKKCSAGGMKCVEIHGPHLGQSLACSPPAIG